VVEPAAGEPQYQAEVLLAAVGQPESLVTLIVAAVVAVKLIIILALMADPV
jgi:hypothetical protein